MEKRYLSNEIGDAYKQWPKNSDIIITSPTGSGKTTFVLTRLLPYAASKEKYVVYFCNRRLLMEQVTGSKLKQSQEEHIKPEDYFRKDISKDLSRWLLVMSYQRCELEESFPTVYQHDTIKMFYDIQKFPRDPEQVMFYVFDEAHYFVTDANFNSYTGFWADSNRMNFPSRRVYLTATPEPLYLFFHRKRLNTARKYSEFWEKQEKIYEVEKEIKRATVANPHVNLKTYKTEWIEEKVPRKLVEELKLANRKKREEWANRIEDNIKPPNGENIYFYHLPINYDYIAEKYFDGFDQIIKLIERNSEERWLIFTNKKEGQELERMLNSGVGCERAVFLSSERIKQKKYKKTVQEITATQKFNCQVLIATSVLDNGVDIKDDTLRNIVIDHYEKTGFIQMLGRKRVRDNERVNLYIKVKNARLISGYQKDVMESLDYVILHEKKRNAQPPPEYALTHYQYLPRERDPELERDKRRHDPLHQRVYAGGFRKHFNMLYLPLSATDGRNMDRMHEAFNEFEVNQSAVLCAAYKLWQYHTALESYHQASEDPTAILQKQLSWIGKEYDETAWVGYEERMERKKKCIDQLEILLRELYDSKIHLAGHDRDEFVQTCVDLLSCDDIEVKAWTKSQYVRKANKKTPGLTLLNKAFVELGIAYRLKGITKSVSGKAVRYWMVIKVHNVDVDPH